MFKGGTSLAKSFGLINRFSEDIDVTVFRQDIGQGVSLDELATMSGKKRLACLDQIRAACRDYVMGDLRHETRMRLREALEAAGIASEMARIDRDPDDPDGQTLLVWYPSVTETAGGYVQPAVRIESGAKSALDPHVSTTVVPFVAPDLQNLDLKVANVTAIEPRWTFWDKVLILHGVRRWFERRNVLRQEGARISRHYYDIHQLLQCMSDSEIFDDSVLTRECAQHARMFFHRPDFDLASAMPGSFALAPTQGMMEALHRDYTRMSEMIFGSIPQFYDVVTSIQRLETRLNSTKE